MKLETFLDLINTLLKMQELCKTFDNGIEKVLNMSFDKNYESDSRSMLLFPVEGIDHLIIKILVNEFGESKDGAEWFVYEGIDQILNGGTKINDWEIKSFEDYYNWLNYNNFCKDNEE